MEEKNLGDTSLIGNLYIDITKSNIVSRHQC